MGWEIRRDDWGIPHLRADTVLELAHAQGLEVARSRGHQVELTRLRAEGRVSELVGASGVAWDVFARRALVAETARTAFAALDAETAAFVTAYAAGVEEGLGARPGDAPRWQPWTPLAVFLAQHVLFATFPGKLWRERLHAVLGDAGLAAFGIDPVPSGSNAFGVAGSRTASGLPLVAGDPHRVLEAPNVYAQVHLVCTGRDDERDAFDVAGYTFPGVPGVQHFAHAGSVAWAITNAMADYQDLWVERLERRGDEVWTTGPDGDERCTHHEERVVVRGADPVTTEVVVTPRGPVVVGETGDDAAYSLGTGSLALGRLGFEALLPLLRARTADDVDGALEHWVEPVNNVVVADATGEVRHRVAGRVPLRPRSPRPVRADDPATRWGGWVDPLPRTPVTDGVVVTANDRATDAFDTIGQDFAAPFRADRLRELLTARDDWDVEAVAGLLTDARATPAAALLAVIARLEGLGERGRAVQTELAGWDREMAVDSETAARYAALRDGVVARLAAALPDALSAPSPHGSLYAAWFALPPKLRSVLPTLLGTAPDLGVDVTALVRAAVEAAGELAPTTWGEHHRYRPLVGGAHPGVDGPAPAVSGVPVAGDTDCVASADGAPGTDDVSRGPCARYVWDLGDRTRSRWSVPLGAAESGPHAEDQHHAWSSGALVPVVTDWDALVPDPG